MELSGFHPGFFVREGKNRSCEVHCSWAHRRLVAEMLLHVEINLKSRGCGWGISLISVFISHALVLQNVYHITINFIYINFKVFSC